MMMKLVFNPTTTTMATLLVTIFSSLTMAANVPMTGYSLSNYTNAVCLDGTPGMYYHYPGTGNGTDKWYIEMQGGGWCSSFDNCLTSRYFTNHGSSSGWGTTIQRNTPFYNDDANINPLTYNWNKVYFRYCDAFSFAGNVSDPITNDDGITMHLKGLETLQAGITDMLHNRGLQNATDVLIGGCSAGGLSTFLHCDRWASQMPAGAQVKCAPDSGFFLNYNATPGKPEFRQLMEDGLDFHQAVLPQACVANHTGNPQECIYPEHIVKYLETPIFIMQTMYDSWARGSWKLSNGNETLVNEFGNYVNSTLVESTKLQAHLASQHGIYLDACLRHCNGFDVEIDGISKVQALQMWYNNDNETTSMGESTYIQEEDYECVECCLAPTPSDFPSQGPTLSVSPSTSPSTNPSNTPSESSSPSSNPTGLIEGRCTNTSLIAWVDLLSCEVGV